LTETGRDFSEVIALEEKQHQCFSLHLGIRWLKGVAKRGLDRFRLAALPAWIGGGNWKL